MARMDLNSAVGALRGKMDGWVYRQLNGQTVVASHRLPRRTKPTPGQADRRKRFRAAQAYAAEVLVDPLRRLVYQKLGAERRTPPNALLISNFLTPPCAHRVRCSGGLWTADENPIAFARRSQSAATGAFLGGAPSVERSQI